MSELRGTVRFGTKAETLERLAGVLTQARVLPQFRLCAGDWAADRAGQLAALEQHGWLARPVIVRSSACDEDGVESSHAGEFDSVANVRGMDELGRAIEHVFLSYRRPCAADQVFVQPQIVQPELSGVAFGLDPQSGGPYLVINYDHGDAIGGVTSGVARDAETCYWFKGSPSPDDVRLAAVAELLLELEQLLGTPALDVEFAWADGELFLLQVRRLTQLAVPARGVAEVAGTLRNIADQAAVLQTADPRILGNGIALGVMPDWNPAEMIGLQPRPLAASVYRFCITDQTWAEQRADYGYRDVRGVPLMHLLGGQPYIDTRASFTSFVPAALPDELARKLVDSYLHTLRARPELHDKVELDIVLHCWTFDGHQRLRTLGGAAFAESEQQQVAATLQRLTRDIMRPGGPWSEDRSCLDEYAAWLEARPDGPAPEAAALWNWLERCRSGGARPFAGLARAGFIAVCLLRSLVRIRLLSAADEDRFMRSLRTIPANMRYARRHFDQAQFLKIYGHLRPGTYDILTPRYDEAVADYFPADLGKVENREEPEVGAEEFSLSPEQRHELSQLLAEHGFTVDVETFLDFLREAIEAREYGKFIYSRGVSEFLRVFGRYTSRLGLTLEEAADVDVSILKEIARGADARTALQQSLDRHRAALPERDGLALPPLILSPQEIWSYHLPRYQPNFITGGSASGPVRTCATQGALTGCILLLPCADPGYDWIFTAGIAGFVTKYGGANSHMAIRARELNVPAVLGIGEPRFQELARARALRIDCQNRQLLPLP